MLYNIVLVFCVLVVLYRMLHHMATMDYREWAGRLTAFAALAFFYALQLVGAVMVAAQARQGAAVLLIGLAGTMLIERRNRSRGGS